jgi:2-hydroxy-3-keto-5-methylthiopentenyl-1-phosphate phosphatase
MIHYILDLDETCINSVEFDQKILDLNIDLEHFILKDEKLNPEFIVYVRPYLKKFLRFIHNQGHIFSFWSAGEKNYVLDIIENILPNNLNDKLAIFASSPIISTKPTKALIGLTKTIVGSLKIFLGISRMAFIFMNLL